MKITDATLEDLKQFFFELLFEYEQYKKQRRSKKDPDLISTRQAYKLFGEGWVKEVILRGLVHRSSSGRAKNSAKYLSKKKLLELRTTYLQ